MVLRQSLRHVLFLVALVSGLVSCRANNAQDMESGVDSTEEKNAAS